ncbi:hypothetical protein CPB85DRAFT_1438306 [Mucidula mucida]|nr:hypothetical protein CPB85DRAFT_1438306 [Mucidula mucida]
MTYEDDSEMGLEQRWMLNATRILALLRRLNTHVLLGSQTRVVQPELGPQQYCFDRLHKYISPAVIGQMYTKLFEIGAYNVLGMMMQGGQVAANANVDSAIIPQWRTSKTRMMVVNSWMDDATPAEAHAEMDRFQKTQLPIFEEVIGTDAGAYSNEADTSEPNF